MVGLYKHSQPNTLYEQTAKRINSFIRQGTFRPGTKLPSVRKLSHEWGISISTVMEAYQLLEINGVIHVRPKSGHYVNPNLRLGRVVTQTVPLPKKPAAVQVNNLVKHLYDDLQNPNLVQLGAGIPCMDLLPDKKLSQALSSVLKRNPTVGTRYSYCPGWEKLRIQIARRYAEIGISISPDSIVVTNGCLEAVSLSLRILCRPGDIVALESPTYFGFLQMLETLGLKVLEIPKYPDTGLSLDALRFALENHPVKACLFTPTFCNPMGSTLPESKKDALVKLLDHYGVPLIEDEISAALPYNNNRPKPVKYFDRKDNNILCSSFTKTVAPGYRVGWMLPGKCLDEVMKLKITLNWSTSTLPQIALAEFLESGGYESYLRKIRRIYKERTHYLVELIEHYFPEGTVVNKPEGGFYVWIHLPEGSDSVQVYEKAIASNITFAPGVMFSSKPRFNDCIRLNAAYATPDVEKAIQTLGRLI